MIQFAVCDDEPYMLDDICARLTDYMLRKKSAFELCRFAGGGELLAYRQPFDVLFLDIQMDGPDGLETARDLRRRGFDGYLIFVTVLRDCVFDSFEVEAYDYLLKPLEASRFQRTMDRALESLEKRSAQNLVIRAGHLCKVIPFHEIVYCEVLGGKIYLHTVKGEIIDYYSRLEDLAKNVDQRFFRCHRSYLANLDWVRGLKDGNVLLEGGRTIPVSRLREQELTQALLLRMKARRR